MCHLQGPKEHWGTPHRPLAPKRSSPGPPVSLLQPRDWAPARQSEALPRGSGVSHQKAATRPTQDETESLREKQMMEHEAMR